MDWGTVWTTAGSIVATFIGAYFLFRNKKVDKQIKDAEVGATAEDAFLKGQVAFQKYVDDVVSREVSAAVADFQIRLSEMEVRLTAVQLESHEMNDAVRSRETELWLWNIHGRAGEIPELPMPILSRLGISHLAGRPPRTQGETL